MNFCKKGGGAFSPDVKKIKNYRSKNNGMFKWQGKRYGRTETKSYGGKRYEIVEEVDRTDLKSFSYKRSLGTDSQTNSPCIVQTIMQEKLFCSQQWLLLNTTSLGMYSVEKVKWLF